MRRLLFVTIELPSPPNRGAQVRDSAMISRLAPTWEIDLVALCDAPPDPEAVAALQARCASVTCVVRGLRSPLRLLGQTGRALLARRPLATGTYVTPELLEAVRTLVARRRHDMVQIEHSFLAPVLQATGPRPAILSLHNVGALQYARLAELPAPPLQKAAATARALLMRRWEARWAARFDAVVAMSEDDAQALAQLGYAGVTQIVGNGADPVPITTPSEPGTLLFVGNMAYPPNADAITFLRADILPRLQGSGSDPQLLVAGFGAPSAPVDADGIAFMGAPESLVPLYARAGLVVAPLRAGGGTRIKILEAMAHGRPVIATRMAAEGLGAPEGEAILYGETGAEIAAHIQALRSDPARAAKIGAGGHAWLSATASWDRQAQRLQAVHAAVAR